METGITNSAGALTVDVPATNAVEESAALLNLPPPVWAFLKTSHTQFADALLTAQNDSDLPFVNVDTLPMHTKSFLRKLIKNNAPLAEFLRDPSFVTLRRQTQQIFKAQLSLEASALLNALRELYEARQRAKGKQPDKVRRYKLKRDSNVVMA